MGVVVFLYGVGFCNPKISSYPQAGVKGYWDYGGFCNPKMSLYPQAGVKGYWDDYGGFCNPKMSLYPQAGVKGYLVFLFSRGGIKGFVLIEIGGFCGRIKGFIGGRIACDRIPGGSLWKLLSFLNGLK